jgi:hypothetical protein
VYPKSPAICPLYFKSDRIAAPQRNNAMGQDRTRAEQNRGEERIISSPNPRRSRPVRGAIHGINCGLSADRLVAKTMPMYQFYVRVQSTVASRFLAMRQVM